MDKRSDEELVNLVRQHGKVEAFGSLVERYQGSVYGLAYVLAGDWAEAQDLTQDTFVRAYVGLRLLRDPAKFAGWLRRLAFGTCMDWLRAFRPAMYRSMGEADDVSQLDSLPMEQHSPDELAETAETEGAVRRAMAQLPPKYRLPLSMFYLEGHSYQKIAEFLELPPGTVKSLIFHAKRLLKPALAAYSMEIEPMVEKEFEKHALPRNFAAKVIRLTQVIVELSVTNVQKSVDFYVDALGFVPRIRYEEKGELDFASVESGTITLFLHHTSPEPDSAQARDARQRVKLWFKPDDLLGLHEILKAKGYQVSEPVKTFYGTQEFFMPDPDGYTIFFQQAAEAPLRASNRAVQSRLLVTDIARSIAFYRDHFGFKVNFSNAAFTDLNNGGTITLITRSGMADALGRDITANQSSNEKRTESVLVITVANPAALYEALATDGVKAVMPPKYLPDAKTTVAYIEDPDGHLIEINDSPHV